jgi:hypothetical protein
MLITMRKMVKHVWERDMDKTQSCMMIIKGAQEIRDRCGEKTWEGYKRLLDGYICTIYNADRFKERVRELYFEANTQFETPSIHLIASIIDEENEKTLEGFYQSFSYSEVDIDNIICLYNDHVSSMMDIWVEEALQSLGYPYMGSPFGTKSRQCNVFADNAQNILFKEFL